MRRYKGSMTTTTEQLERPAPAAPASPQTRPPQASILVVDDDPRNLIALSALLESMGQDCVLANSGEEALRKVHEHDFAVILLDARMPGVDGFATARMIRETERSRNTPIIFLTGVYEDVSSMFRGYEAGAVDYIVKPLVPEILKTKISVFVELFNKNAVLTREIAERKRAEEQVRRSEENLRALAARLESVREEERTRIAREIHDELGQVLTGIKMELTWVAKRLPSKSQPLEQKLESMFDLIDDSVNAVRRISSGLRPEALDKLGLAAAIEWQLREFQMRTGIRCKVTVPDGGVSADQERSTALFRIFQELLTNVARHANATKVEVLLRADGDAMHLEVQDNGRGIVEQDIKDSKSLGLLGMRERVFPFGGRFEIKGVKGKGSRATVSIPLGQADPAPGGAN
jgi:signal transduction histidine kinase